MKKKVIAYLHTHWDREWYRDFDVVLDLLEKKKIPSFYFDGQVAALMDYLEIRPEKEKLVRKLIKNKKLFIGPFYCLIDEFLTDKTCFEKNLEIGIKISKDFGCENFIGYLADTFGHSKNVPLLLQKFGIDKAMVWRGVGDLPADFVFNGVNTVNLVRGYFMDIFSADISIEAKAGWLEKDLDKIAQKASDYILLPIGADHLAVEENIAEQIKQVNKYLSNYKIKLGSPFDYFDKVSFDVNWNDELRDNSKTFILPGSYSARLNLKQYNVKCCYLLEQADKIQKRFGSKYNNIIDYAYKLLLQNQAHDSICGCSTDLVHRENIVRYEKIIQIAETVIEELRQIYNFETPVFKSDRPLEGYDVIKVEPGFENSLLYDIKKIPVTEDYKMIYTLKKTPEKFCPIRIYLKNGKLYADNVEIQFVRRIDMGDAYNFGAVPEDYGEVANIISIDNSLIRTDFFDVFFERGENMINFKIVWDNKLKNKLWQVKFILPDSIRETFSEDMDTVIKRSFDPDYDMLQNLPKKPGLEAKTNFAPMQRLVWAQGFGIVTKGLTEYEVFKNTLSITILRSIGVISNPHNTSRSTPAGPPVDVADAQQLGINSAEFSVAFFDIENWKRYINEVFPQF